MTRTFFPDGSFDLEWVDTSLRIVDHKFCPSSSSGLEFSSVLLGPVELEDNSALLPEVAIFAGLGNRTERPDVAAER